MKIEWHNRADSALPDAASIDKHDFVCVLCDVCEISKLVDEESTVKMMLQMLRGPLWLANLKNTFFWLINQMLRSICCEPLTAPENESWQNEMSKYNQRTDGTEIQL